MEERKKKVRAKTAAPVWNRADFFHVFGKNGIEGDEKGHVRSLEFIALPGEEFSLLETFSIEDRERKNLYEIYKVKTDRYPISPLYIDSRFFEGFYEQNKKKIEGEKIHWDNEKRETIVKELKKRVGLPYFWGGNWSYGVPELLDYYPPKIDLSEEEKSRWIMKGVDCSGLLYEVMQGKIPRNTGQMHRMGTSLPIENFSPGEIRREVKPLDLILYLGHVIIIINNDEVIESIEGKGVIISSFTSRLEDILSEKKRSNFWDPKNADEIFHIVRWGG